MMDYKEEQEQHTEEQDEPQAEDMEMDDDDAPYLDLRDDRERQAYALLKRQDFGHTKAFDLDLLVKTSMDVDIAQVWHAIRWIVLCPLRRMVLVSSPSNFFALFGRWMMEFLFNSLEMSFMSLGRFCVITLVLARACRFLLNKLVAVSIATIFGV
jgi:hypothetical protein